MKRIISQLAGYLLVCVLLLGLTLPILPVTPAQAGTETYNHIIPFTITDTSGVARTNVPVIITYDVDGNLVDYGLINATATDTYVDSSGAGNSPVGSGTAYDYLMSTSNMTVVIPSLPAYGSVTINLYTGYSPSQTTFPIILGNGGSVSTNDTAALEPVGNATMSIDGHINTDAGASKNLANKDGAVTIFVSPDVSENISANVSSTTSGSPASNNTSSTSTPVYTGSASERTGERINDFIGTISSVDWYLGKTGVPAGTTYARVYNADTDALIGTVGSKDVTEIAAGPAYVTYSGTSVSVNNPTDIRVSFALEGGDAAAYVSTYHVTTGSTTDLGIYTSYNGTAWVDQATWDARYQNLTWSPIINQVSTTGISSGEHTVVFEIATPFMGIAVDQGTDLLPTTENLTFNAPLWQSELSGSSIVTIDSNEYSATVSEVVYTTSGRVFDGDDDYILFGDDAAFDGFTVGATWEYWLKRDAGADVRYFSAKFGAAGQRAYLLSVNADNEIDAQLYGADGSTQGRSTTTAGLGDTNFHHIVITWEPNEFGKVYVDTVLQTVTTSGTEPASFKDTTASLYMGYTASSFGGTIGEMRLYNRALTQDEIEQNYNATKSKYTSGNIYIYSTLGTIADTANNWNWMQNGSIAYADSISLEVGGTQVLEYAPTGLINGTTLVDNEGTKNGDITWGTNSGITVTGGSIMDSESPTSIGATSAMMQGELFDIGTYAAVYISFEYGLDTDYGYFTSETSVDGEQTLSTTLTGLTPETTYHYRAIARSGQVYSYGADTTLTTTSTGTTGSTTPLIRSVGAFSSYQSTGDWLFTAEVVCTYPPYYPTGAPASYFHVQLVGEDGTVLGSVPLRQWGDRPISIYLNSSANITNQSAYTIRVTNVSSANISVSTSESFDGTDWYGDDLSWLDRWCIGAALKMQGTDGTTTSDPYVTVSATTGEIITDAATGYFEVGIPNITIVRPNLFTSVKYKEDIAVLKSGTVYNSGTTLTDRVGATIVADSETVADVFGLSGQQFLMYMIFGVVLFCIIYTVSQTKGFGALGAACLSLPIMAASMYFNITPMHLVIGFTVVYVILFVRQFIWKTM